MVDLFHRNFFAMHTRFEVVTYDKDATLMEEMFEAIQSNVKRLESIISCFDKTSEVFMINQLQPTRLYVVSDALFEIIKKTKLYKNQTQGCFDYCFPDSIIDNDKAHLGEVGNYVIELDDSSNSIRFIKAGFRLDFGAIGKGLALDRVGDLLDKMGVSNCFISFGESSILTRGQHPHGPYWPFAIANDDRKLKLNNAAVSTSATYQPNGNNHILDPRTYQLVKENKMITIKSNSAIEAEVLSTALLVAKDDEAQEILSNFKNYEIIKSWE